METETQALHGYLNGPGDPAAIHTLNGITDWLVRH
jgi:hypothetical protein